MNPANNQQEAGSERGHWPKMLYVCDECGEAVPNGCVHRRQGGRLRDIEVIPAARERELERALEKRDKLIHKVRSILGRGDLSRDSGLTDEAARLAAIIAIDQARSVSALSETPGHGRAS